MASVFARTIPLLLPTILLGLIGSGVTTPTEIATIAAAYALALAFLVCRTVTPLQLFPVIFVTLKATVMIATIMAGAFVFNYAVANESLPRLALSLPIHGGLLLQ